uniref:Uncharacterized protein n=1 Tax=Bionectria ochroleuca TaxID=29856 RepID=A0A8H7N5S9_BIOOC
MLWYMNQQVSLNFGHWIFKLQYRIDTTGFHKRVSYPARCVSYYFLCQTASSSSATTSTDYQVSSCLCETISIDTLSHSSCPVTRITSFPELVVGLGMEPCDGIDMEGRPES